MSNHIVDLIGKSFHVSIGEPWDFESNAGQNLMKGRIREIVFDQTGSPLILCEVIPFSSSGRSISSIVAVNRYQNTQDVIESLRLSGSAGLNFIFRRSGEIFSVDNVETVLNRGADCSFLVGTMKLEIELNYSERSAVREASGGMA